MKIDPAAQAQALRARLVALCERGVTLRRVAATMQPPADSSNLSAFKSGVHWGGARLARLAVALDALEQQAPPVHVPPERPTDRAPPPEHDDAHQAEEEPAPAAAPPVAATLPAPPPEPAPRPGDGWPAPGTIGRAIVELLAEQGPTDTGALAVALEGEEENVRAMCGQLVKRGLLLRLDGRRFALAG